VTACAARRREAGRTGVGACWAAACGETGVAKKSTR
jgi:hypothetical protein